MRLADLIDPKLEVPALVFGSLPPGGRDLDLLVRSRDLPQVERVLLEAGCEQRGHAFALLAACTADAADVVPVEGWGLGSGEVTRVFEDALPIEGYRNLLRPAPSDALLILARRVARGAGFDGNKRRKVAAIIEEQPTAWDVAASRAESWRCSAALPALRSAYDLGVEIPGPERALALREQMGTTPMRRAAALVRSRIGPGRGGHVVALSGLDGSGKSTQGEALVTTLERLGFEAAVEWTKIARSPSLDLIARPFKALLGRVVAEERLPVEPDPDEAERNYPDGPPPPPDVGKRLRRRSPLLTYLWAFLVAFTNALDHRRAVVRHLRAGRVVVCDRYVLDSAAHLRRRYGTDGRFRPHTLLIRVLSPRTTRAYFLDVAPETARSRKPEQYTVPELRELRRVYLEEAAHLPVTVVEGERPVEELCAEIGRDVWDALGGKG